MCVPVLALTVGGGDSLNLAFYAAPQILWWLFCIIWWACWGPPRNRGLFFGGIVAADWLLLHMVSSGGESERWFGYILFSPVAVVLGGFAGGLAGGVARRLSKKAQPAAAPNGGPATRLGHSGVTEGPPSVS